MKQSTRALNVKAAMLALRLRKSNTIELEDSFCVFDLASKLGFEVKFIDIPSMEGIYLSKPKKTVLISAHRPSGRQRFTCAHELGHDLFGHSVHIDELLDSEFTKAKKVNEQLSDIFASFLLMPSTTVANGFMRRGWDIKAPTPWQIYKISAWLGTGYQTLINHLHYGLNKISKHHLKELLRKTPKEIKKQIIGYVTSHNVVPVDFEWSGRPIDLYVKDFVTFPDKTTVHGENLLQTEYKNGIFIFQATKPGICQAACRDKNWASFIRVAKENYVGRAKYRHLEEY